MNLDAIRNYAGTPKGFVELVEAEMSSYGHIAYKFDGENWHVDFVTGGYSENEDIAGILDKSFFGLCFWESIHRGGLYTYEIHESQWEMDFGALGKPCWRDAT